MPQTAELELQAVQMFKKLKGDAVQAMIPAEAIVFSSQAGTLKKVGAYWLPFIVYTTADLVKTVLISKEASL